MKSQFLSNAQLRFDENTERIEKCLQLLGEEELWYSPNQSSNSIANLILHLCGNIGQYVLSGLGGEQDQRNRQEEFTSRETHSRAELYDILLTTVSAAKEIINAMDEEELCMIYRIQGFDLDGISVVIHVVEHYSYHTGQIALLTKLIKNQDLGFYAGQNLDIKN